jgi:GT2 family glycosyltransferase
MRVCTESSSKRSQGSCVSSEIVLCTRNRAKEVQCLLANLERQTLKPALLIVDSSDDAGTHEAIITFDERGAWPHVRYVHAEPGLTRQRMKGVRLLRDETRIVHFIDDDVELDAEYFFQIEQVFAESTDILGVGGWITNTPWRKVRFTGPLFLLDSQAEEGRVLASGANVLLHHPSGVVDVDWLSGSAMSYRRSVFDTLAFDERMTGYSLGEDVDFSFRASRIGRVVVTERAQLRHLFSETNRWDIARLAREDAVRRHRFVAELRGHGVNRTAFWWSIFGAIGTNAIRGLIRRNRLDCRIAASLVRGIAEIMRSGPVPPNPRLGAARIVP